MKKTALLIIDMQVGAARWDAPPFFGMDDLIGRLKRLIQKAPTAGVPVFYAQHHNPNGFPAYGSPDWQLITETGPQVGEVVIHKSTPDVFLNTSLHEQLQAGGTERLVIGGIQTAGCVDTTCRRAFSLGYEVVLVEDGHTTFDSPQLAARQIIAHHNHVISNWFGKVIPAEEISFRAAE